MRDALRAGFGVSLMPLPYVEDDLRDGRFRSAFYEWITVETTLYAVYPSRQHIAPRRRVFLDFLIEEFARKTPGRQVRNVTEAPDQPA